MFNEKIQITKFLPKFFCRYFQQISMSLVKIGQNKWKKILVKILWFEFFHLTVKNRDFSVY